MIRATRGANYFNPDERTREILLERPSLSLSEANGQAWEEGRRTLEFAIQNGSNYAFETTLGGNTIVSLIEFAAKMGFDVRIWYAGLSSPELHISRVRARVAKGGHDIPEGKIRERYVRSRKNLIRLLPFLTELRVYDNSKSADPAIKKPIPQLLLHLSEGNVLVPAELESTPEWAREIVEAAFALARPQSQE